MEGLFMNFVVMTRKGLVSLPWIDFCVRTIFKADDHSRPT
jgi:hypothetical protein